MKIEHILLPTDLSPASEVAFSHAVVLAERFDAKVTLLHVEALSSSDLIVWGDEALKQSIREDLRSRQERLARDRRVLVEAGVRARAEMLGGDPIKEVLKFASTHDVDLILMPKHGAGRFERLLLGSVSKGVVRRASVPVMLVEAGVSPQRAPQEVYRELLSATDFSDDSRRGLRCALELAEALDGQVTVVHILRPPMLEHGLGEVPWLPKPLGRLYERAQGSLTRALEALGSERLTGVVEVAESVARRIVALADEREAGLIVLPSHGKGAVMSALLGSTTLRVLKLTTRPVMILPSAFLSAGD